MATVFFSYSHADELLRDQLETQLALLKRQGVIETWHDRRIGAGEDLHNAISSNLEQADIILLLVSPDFLASDYCYEKEMMRALERHDAGEAVVIPVILRPSDWHGAPFGRLMATPKDGRPVTQAPDRDHALLEVAKAIRGAAERLGRKASIPNVITIPNPPVRVAEPRSSNLRLAKQFTDRDIDTFRNETFEYMAKFFENSLHEVEDRNPGIEGNFRRIDGNRFTATLYRNGKSAAVCTIFMGGHFGKGIAYSSNETSASNSFNEHLSAESDEQSMFLRSMGMAHFTGNVRDQKLSKEGAAELYWEMFIARLQQN